MSDQPLFSVIIPVAGRTTYLKQCLESVYSQHDPATTEVIIADDASNEAEWHDMTRILNEVTKGSGHYKMRSTTQRLGWAQNINDAVKDLSTGRFIVVLHDDDLLAPGFFERTAAAIKQTPMALVVSTQFLCLMPDGTSFGPIGALRPTTGLIGAQERANMIVQNPLQVCAVAFSRKAFDLVGGFRTDLPYTQDWYAWVMMARFPWLHVAEPLAIYREHEENLGAVMRQDGRAARGIMDTIRLFEKDVPAGLLAQAKAVHGFGMLYNAWQNWGNPMGRDVLWCGLELLKGTYNDPPKDVQATEVEEDVSAAVVESASEV